MKNKEIKLPASVENNIISIINTIEKIYEIKFTELSLLTIRIDNNTEEVRNQILEVRNLLRNQMEICDEQITTLFEDENYTGKQFLKNFIEEFTLVDAKPKKRYAYYDAERLIRDEYEFCKNRKVRKAINKMESKEESSINFPTTILRKLRLKRYLQTAKVFIILKI